MSHMLNLGAGVQSTTVLLMSIEGELHRLDHALLRPLLYPVSYACCELSLSEVQS